MCSILRHIFFHLKESMQFHISLKMKIIWMKKLFQERNRTLMKVLPENLPTICNQRHISKFSISCLTKCSLGKMGCCLPTPALVYSLNFYNKMWDIFIIYDFKYPWNIFWGKNLQNLDVWIGEWTISRISWCPWLLYW